MRYLIMLLWIPLCFSQETKIEKNLKNKNFLWEISQVEKKIHILGSIHIGNKSLYPMNPAVDQFFEASDRLALEIELNDKNIQFVQEFMAREAFYKSGSIKDDFNEEELKKITSWMSENHIPENVWKKMKPWLLYLTITNLNSNRAKLSEHYGIDMFYSKKANEIGKPIIELETAESQMNLFINLPDVKKLLLESCSISLEEGKKEILKMLNCIKEGDNKKLLEIINEMREISPAAHESLIVQRNKNMVEKIELYMKDKEKTFIIVGAAHLLGKEGIIELLKNKKYSLKRL